MWFNILKQFGKYAHGKFIPEWIQNAPKNLVQEFINGYMAADGHVSKKNSNKIVTVSHNLAYGVQRLYLKIGQKNRYWAGFCCKSFKEKSVKKEEFNDEISDWKDKPSFSSSGFRVELQNDDGAGYVGTIYLGSEEKPARVLFDTGSDYLAVTSDLCMDPKLGK
jgi:hypothetical protein